MHLSHSLIICYVNEVRMVKKMYQMRSLGSVYIKTGSVYCDYLLNLFYHKQQQTNYMKHYIGSSKFQNNYYSVGQRLFTFCLVMTEVGSGSSFFYLARYHEKKGHRSSAGFKPAPCVQSDADNYQGFDAVYAFNFKEY